MPEFTCTSCGSTFTLPEDVLARYPGWTPRSCRRCRDGKGAGGGGVGRGPAPTARRSGEEHLTVAEVLAKYAKGPDDGVFIDGSAIPNPGPGGWGAVYVVAGEVVAQDYGHEPRTTNNRMELTALIKGYDLVPAGTPVTVYTDSRLAVDTITKWAAGWERRGWVRKGGAVQNLELVQELYARAKARPDITLTWIKAHAGSRWNEYADSLSTAWARDDL
jgi:ribonuclease HI